MDAHRDVSRRGTWLQGWGSLHWALLVSVLVHAALLTVRFVDPERFNRVFEATPLEVVLVNARSQQQPEKAQAIAQASLAGGGEAAQGRATSPLPSSTLSRMGDALEEEEQRRIESLKEQQNQVLAQVRQQLARMPAPELAAQQQDPATVERERQRLVLVKLLAEIEKRINEENARPKKRYVSPATQEAVYAVYYDGLRRRIEERGTRQFPQVAGRKLYGELTMMITVNHSGQVLQTEVVRPSDTPVLDRQAQALVRSLSFERFSPAMRQRADQIVVVSRFRFTRDDTLLTQQAQP
jgi:periplasmic protein TonB